MLPVLVVAPKRVAEHVWPAEVPKWRPDLSVKVAAGTAKKRRDTLAMDTDIMVISRDNVADVLPHVSRFRTVIIDELSSFKNRGSNRWKAMHLITDRVERVWGLTGTPAPNGLLDLWAQVYLLDGGKRLGKNITAFRTRYFYPTGKLQNGTPIGWEPYPETPDRVHALVEDICLYMETEGRVDLPATTFNDVVVPMTAQTRAIYREMKNNLVVNLELLGGEIHSADTASAVSNRLSQITAGFLYVDDTDLRGAQYTLIHQEKARAVREIIEGTGSPVVVGYWFKAELEILQKELGAMAHTIDEPGVLERWDRGEIPVLLLHPASAGHGLNLQAGGHTMVYASLPWSLELYQQFNKRLPRQGQQHPVVIHRLVTPHSTDAAKIKVLEEKATIQQALLDHLRAPL